MLVNVLKDFFLGLFCYHSVVYHVISIISKLSHN